MAEVVVDTNVLLVAERMHNEVAEECVLSCVQHLQAIKDEGTVVLDDRYRVLGEYQNKLSTRKGKGAGTVFLKWLLQHQANSRHVVYVSLTETAANCFLEFPTAALEADFDPSDRKFPAIANAHPSRPTILQATDCKWLRWWPSLAAAGISVEFLCPEDICRFYRNKYRDQPVPALP